MPSNTFHNLPEEKKNRVLNASFLEFALNDYRNASISNMG